MLEIVPMSNVEEFGHIHSKKNLFFVSYNGVIDMINM